jgi:hypothetical protein
MSASLYIEGRRIGTKSTALPFNDDEPIIRLTDARRGSERLLIAILKAKGIERPKPVAALPVFAPPPKRKPFKRRGRPRGDRKRRRIDPRIIRIQELISKHFKITVEAMMTKRRVHEVAHPRQIAMYLARQITGAPYADIAFHFDGLDHTTIIHACREVAKRIDRKDRKTIDALIAAQQAARA